MTQATSFESGLLAPRIVSNRRSLAAFLHAQDVLPSLPSEIHAAATADATSRLVNTPQFPTRILPGVDEETGEIIWRETAIEELRDREPFKIEPRATDAAGAYVVLGYRAWDDTYRMRPVLEAQRQQPPQPSVGPRITNALTHNGRKAIDESARYLASIGKGFTTMLTLTADDAARQRIAVQIVEGDYCTLGQRQVAEAEGDFCSLDGDTNPVAVHAACCPLGWMDREEVSHHGRFTPMVHGNSWVYGVHADGDFSDLETRQYWPLMVNYCKWPRGREVEVLEAWAGPVLQQQGELIVGPTVEGIHTLKPVSSLQQEASRFLDGAQKIYQRGMDYQPAVTYSVRQGEETERWRIECLGKDGEPHIERLPGHATGYTPGDVVQWMRGKKPGSMIWFRVNSMGKPKVPRELKALSEEGAPFTMLKAIGEPLRYCWVAENPKNEAGKDNPHMHINLSWLVPREAFEAWAARLEGIWGQGFAHLERLRDATAAGAYLLKAAGYLAKGEDGSQGWIIGNRYFVSREARAPKFEGVAVLPYEQFPLLMNRAREHQELKLAGLRMMRREARAAIKTATPTGKQRLIAKCKRWAKLLDGRAIIAGQWQMLLKGAGALARFFSWAGADSKADAEGVELPTRPEGLRWSMDWLLWKPQAVADATYVGGHLTEQTGLISEDGIEELPTDGTYCLLSKKDLVMKVPGREKHWHAPKTEDVKKLHEGMHGWRRFLSMPAPLTDGDWEQLREFHDRFEPMPAWA